MFISKDTFEIYNNLLDVLEECWKHQAIAFIELVDGQA